jgi:hypothetical protein
LCLNLVKYTSNLIWNSKDSNFCQFYLTKVAKHAWEWTVLPACGRNFHWLSPTVEMHAPHYFGLNVDLQLVIRSEISLWEKQMPWINSGSDILIDTIHPAYHFAFQLCVYANLLIFVQILSPSLQMLCLSHTLSLSLR